MPARFFSGCVSVLYTDGVLRYNRIENESGKDATVSIATAIRELRIASNLSQQDLADRLFVSRELISKWERGICRPDYRTIRTIAEFFDVPTDRILDRGDLIFRELSDCVPDGGSSSAENLPDLLTRFLKTLPKRDAAVFLYRYYYLLTTSEIADKCGIGENHVRSSLSKARKKLKKIIREELQ